MNIKRIETFISLAEMQEEYMYEGNSKEFNKLHKKITKLLDKIIEDNSICLLLNTLNHTNESARLWSATILLKNNFSQAMSKLKEMTELNSIYGLKAKTTIDMWEKGMI